jgi:hypothetical protein
LQRPLIVIAVDHQSVLDALALPGADFEDNLQIACAKAAGPDLIVTRDPAGFRDSPVPVLSPTMRSCASLRQRPTILAENAPEIVTTSDARGPDTATATPLCR